jgi:hypothetical protein
VPGHHIHVCGGTASQRERTSSLKPHCAVVHACHFEGSTRHAMRGARRGCAARSSFCLSGSIMHCGAANWCMCETHAQNSGSQNRTRHSPRRTVPCAVCAECCFTFVFGWYHRRSSVRTCIARTKAARSAGLPLWRARKSEAARCNACLLSNHSVSIRAKVQPCFSSALRHGCDQIVAALKSPRGFQGHLGQATHLHQACHPVLRPDRRWCVHSQILTAYEC